MLLVVPCSLSILDYRRPITKDPESKVLNVCLGSHVVVDQFVAPQSCFALYHHRVSVDVLKVGIYKGGGYLLKLIHKIRSPGCAFRARGVEAIRQNMLDSPEIAYPKSLLPSSLKSEQEAFDRAHSSK